MGSIGEAVGRRAVSPSRGWERSGMRPRGVVSRVQRRRCFTRWRSRVPTVPLCYVGFYALSGRRTNSLTDKILIARRDNNQPARNRVSAAEAVDDERRAPFRLPAGFALVSGAISAPRFRFRRS